MEGFYVFECNNNVCESYISENNPPATKRPTEETLGTEITDAAQQRDIFFANSQKDTGDFKQYFC